MEYQGLGIEELIRLAGCLGSEIPVLTVERHRDWILVIWYKEQGEQSMLWYFICTENKKLRRCWCPILSEIKDPDTGKEFTGYIGSYISKCFDQSTLFDEMLTNRDTSLPLVELIMEYIKQEIIPLAEKFSQEELSRLSDNDS